MATMCETCTDPGHCCRDFSVFQDGKAKTFWLDGDGTAESFLAEQDLPFTPRVIGEFVVEKTGRRYASYRFSCPMLTDKGRCSIYQNRPDMCRAYEAGSDTLCVYYSDEEQANNETT